MKSLLVLVLPVSVSVAAAPATAREVSFNLANATTSTVTEFYLSLPGESSWGANLLTARLPSGARVPVRIDGAETCIFDIRTVFDDEVETEDRSFDLCDMPDYRIEEK